MRIPLILTALVACTSAFSFSPSAPRLLKPISAQQCSLPALASHQARVSQGLRSRSSVLADLKAEQEPEGVEPSTPQPATLSRAQVLKFGLAAGAWAVSSFGAEAAQTVASDSARPGWLRGLTKDSEAGFAGAKKEATACDYFECTEVGNDTFEGLLARTKVNDLSFMAPTKWEKTVEGDTTKWSGPDGTVVTVKILDEEIEKPIKVDVSSGIALAKAGLVLQKANPNLTRPFFAWKSSGGSVRYIKSEDVVFYTFGPLEGFTPCLSDVTGEALPPTLCKNTDFTGIADVAGYKGKTYVLSAYCKTEDVKKNGKLLSAMLLSLSFA